MQIIKKLWWHGDEDCECLFEWEAKNVLEKGKVQKDDRLYLLNSTLALMLLPIQGSGH